MLRLQIVDRGYVFLWDDDHMVWSLRADVLESDHVVVLIDDLCGNVARRDFTEQAIVGHLPPLSTPGNARPPRRHRQVSLLAIRSPGPDGKDGQ